MKTNRNNKLRNRIFAITAALALVMSVGICAFADDDISPDRWTSTETDYDYSDQDLDDDGTSGGNTDYDGDSGSGDYIPPMNPTNAPGDGDYVPPTNPTSPPGGGDYVPPTNPTNPTYPSNPTNPPSGDDIPPAIYNPTETTPPTNDPTAQPDNKPTATPSVSPTPDPEATEEPSPSPSTSPKASPTPADDTPAYSIFGKISTGSNNISSTLTIAGVILVALGVVGILSLIVWTISSRARQKSELEEIYETVGNATRGRKNPSATAAATAKTADRTKKPETTQAQQNIQRNGKPQQRTASINQVKKDPYSYDDNFAYVQSSTGRTAQKPIKPSTPQKPAAKRPPVEGIVATSTGKSSSAAQMRAQKADAAKKSLQTKDIDALIDDVLNSDD